MTDLSGLDDHALAYAEFIRDHEEATDVLMERVGSETLKQHRIRLLSDNDPKRRFLNEANLKYALSEGKVAVYSIVLGSFEVEIRALLLDREQTEKPQRFIDSGSFGSVYAEDCVQFSDSNRRIVQKIITASSNDKVIRQSTGVTMTKECLQEVVHEIAMLKLMSMYSIAPAILTDMEIDIVCYNTSAVIFMEELQPVKLASLKEYYQFEQIIKRKLLMMHRLGIAHRDIKPNNIMASLEGGDYFYIDFGIAQAIEETPKERSQTTVEGTPLFMGDEMRELINSRGSIVSVNLYYNDFSALRKSLYQVKSAVERRIERTHQQSRRKQDSQKQEIGKLAKRVDIQPRPIVASPAYSSALLYGSVIFRQNLSEQGKRQFQKMAVGNSAGQWILSVLDSLVPDQHVLEKIKLVPSNTNDDSPVQKYFRLRRQAKQDRGKIISNYSKLFSRGYATYQKLIEMGHQNSNELKYLLNKTEQSIFNEKSLESVSVYRAGLFNDRSTLQQHFYNKIRMAHKRQASHEVLFGLYCELLKTYTYGDESLMHCVFIQCEDMCLGRATVSLLRILEVIYNHRTVGEEQLKQLFSEYKKYEEDETRQVETSVRLLEFCLNQDFEKCFEEVTVFLSRFLRQDSQDPFIIHNFARAKLLYGLYILKKDSREGQKLIRETEIYDWAVSNSREGELRAEFHLQGLASLQQQLRFLHKSDQAPKLRTIVCYSKLLRLSDPQSQYLIAAELELLLKYLMKKVNQQQLGRTSTCSRVVEYAGTELLKYYCDIDEKNVEDILARLLLFFGGYQPNTNPYIPIRYQNTLTLEEVYYRLGDNLNAALLDPLLKKAINHVTKQLYRQQAILPIEKQETIEQKTVYSSDARLYEWLGWLHFTWKDPKCIQYVRTTLNFYRAKLARQEASRRWLKSVNSRTDLNELQTRSTREKIFELYYKLSTYCYWLDVRQSLYYARKALMFGSRIKDFEPEKIAKTYYQLALVSIKLERTIDAAYYSYCCNFHSQSLSADKLIEAITKDTPAIEAALKGELLEHTLPYQILSLTIILLKRLLRHSLRNSSELALVYSGALARLTKEAK